MFHLGGGGQSANIRGLNNGGQTNARQAGNHNSTQGRMSNLPTRRGLASRSRVLNNSLQGSVRKDETWNTSQGQRSFSHNQTGAMFGAILSAWCAMEMAIIARFF